MKPAVLWALLAAAGATQALGDDDPMREREPTPEGAGSDADSVAAARSIMTLVRRG